MKKMQQHMLRTFFALELVAFGYLYVFGNNGLQSLRVVAQENADIECEIEHLNQEVAALEVEITAWNQHPFYREKIAREQLQMARRDDRIYFVGLPR